MDIYFGRIKLLPHKIPAGVSRYIVLIANFKKKMREKQNCCNVIP